MKANALIVTLGVIGLVGVGGYAAYQLGMNRGMQMGAPTSASAPANSASPQKAGDVDPTTGKKVLHWHDPMVPGQKFDKPGKSPFMDMQLVPAYARGDGDEGSVSISPRVQQNLGIRLGEVTRGTLAPPVEAVGSVAYNERDVVVVQARSNAFVERLLVRAPLDAVRKGQPLAEVYAPDWVAAQEEYLAVKRMSGAGLDTLADAAKQRMRLAGMTEDHIRLVETTGKVHPHMTITAPTSGVIAELAAREGMTVMAGAPLFRISGLGTVWVNAELPESQAGLVRPGNPVEARTPALPGDVFKGRVSAILPEVNPTTRTLKARVELANPGAKLVPGMFATVNFTPTMRKDSLLVPTEAVIQTGKRTVVIVADGSGGFRPVDVEMGVESNGQTEIRKGLQAGQKVVVSGQFLLDSEASLRASTTRMGGSESPTAGASKPIDAVHRGEGKVENIGKGEVTLSHGPIPSLQWPAMTMAFKVQPDVVPKNIRVGDPVAFDVRQKDGAYEITKITPIAPNPAAASGMKSDTGTKK
jgi:Cu(I)/Ag(I) efflux system membrane fusion protein